MPGEAPFDSNMPVSDDDIGDPAMIGRDSSAPMLGAPGDDDIELDDDDTSYDTGSGDEPYTFSGDDTPSTEYPTYDRDVARKG